MSLAVNDIPALDAILSLPEYGQPTAEIHLDDPGDGTFEAILSEGVATLSLDTSEFANSETFVGRVVQSQSQSFGLIGSLSLTAGFGLHLSDTIEPRAYHDERGVTTLTILQDILSDTQHTLGVANIEKPQQGIHFFRERASAGLLLTALLGRTWTFDLSGNLTVASDSQDFPSFDVLKYDSGNQVALLALDNLKDPRGLVLPEINKVVSSCTITMNRHGIRAECKLGEVSSFAQTLEAIIESIIARKVLPKEKYRVHSMAGSGRVYLQPFDTSRGLPDLINVPQFPGVGGAAPTLNPGQVVLVDWIANDRTQPIITGYIGESEDGHVSSQITFNESVAVAARVNDPVSVSPLPGQTISIGVSGPVVQGVPYPFTFAMTVPVPGKNPAHLHGEITDSDSSVRL